jgi:chromosomal replication initiator protein
VDKRSAKEIWEATKGALQIQVNKANYQTWLKDTIGLSYQGNQFVVGTPSAFAKEWLEKRLHSLVQKTLISVAGQDTEVQFQVCSKEEASYKTPSKSPATKFNQRYTFDTFVVGWCNRLAYAAALGVAEEPGYQNNPLYIYGESGLGKTHLAHAIANTASENGFKVIYASAEQFTNEFIKAIREAKTDQFQTKFRSADLFLMEDIQFIEGKPKTQQGLFHTFNELHNANRQVVITGDRPPDMMPLVDGKLHSCFKCGLIAAIHSPDLETRLAILQTKAEQQQAHINEAILQVIAQRCQENVQELETSLNRLIAHSKLSGKPLTLELAEQALQSTTPKTTLTPDFILDTVASYFEISLEALKSRQRDHKTTLARQVSIYLIREKTGCLPEEIGNILGKRDRSTIVQNYYKVANAIPTNPTLEKDLHQILEKLPP